MKLPKKLARSATFAPLFGCSSLLGASTPRGSLTIDRISEIKYPTNQTCSPDNSTIAFLWDAASKQDLYTVNVGAAPVAPTDFPVNPETLRSDIGHFEWTTAQDVIFSKGNQLWTVSIVTRKPVRLPAFDGVSVFSTIA